MGRPNQALAQCPLVVARTPRICFGGYRGNHLLDQPPGISGIHALLRGPRGLGVTAEATQRFTKDGSGLDNYHRRSVLPGDLPGMGLINLVPLMSVSFARRGKLEIRAGTQGS